ncbi:MAG: adenylosuccinate lyase [Gemmatimonadetes bacterium]|nr:adenylosuccinate lyase [Gemmatimonadota bacterium]
MSGQWTSPLAERYASRAMLELWSPATRHGLWRRLWLALSEAEQELGVPIPDAALAQMRAHLDDVDFAAAAVYEKRFRHDVMAHVHAFGDVAPAAKAFIHLGATSAFVTDNADLVQMRRGMALHRIATIPFRGVKGTTGTQASFLELFHGDHAKVRELDRRVCAKLGFAASIPVSGQTYSRKVDAQVLGAVAGVAASAAKLASDLRVLQAFGEIEEPFEKEQIGSSAMAYKRNPMRSERINALARFVLALEPNANQTHSVQFLERTLDDSANRRLAIPESFLATDAILVLVGNIVRGLEVHPARIRRRLMDELPFMATEELMVRAVRAGGDRQVAHEVIRRHAIAAARAMKDEGKANDLLERLAGDPEMNVRVDELAAALDPQRFVGRAPEQVDEFLAEAVAPRLAKLTAVVEAEEVRV